MIYIDSGFGLGNNSDRSGVVAVVKRHPELTP
jgi:hypothetical protein